jgi:hypothetical protein
MCYRTNVSNFYSENRGALFPVLVVITGRWIRRRGMSRPDARNSQRQARSRARAVQGNSRGRTRRRRGHQLVHVPRKHRSNNEKRERESGKPFIHGTASPCCLTTCTAGSPPQIFTLPAPAGVRGLRFPPLASKVDRVGKTISHLSLCCAAAEPISQFS